MNTWTEEDSDWLEDVTSVEHPRPTHRIIWRPVIEIELCLPPSADPQDALENLATGWNDAMPEEDGWYYFDRHAPCWVTDVAINSSDQRIEATANADGTSERSSTHG